MYGSSTNSGVFALTYFVILAVLVIFYLACAWRINTKAGQAGWKAIIPIYNIYILLKIINRPGWWLILFLIPFVNIVISVILALDLAKVFGKTPVFGVVALWLFSFIGYPILAFGSAKYQGSGPTVNPMPPTPVNPVAPAPQTPSTPTAA